MRLRMVWMMLFGFTWALGGCGAGGGQTLTSTPSGGRPSPTLTLTVDHASLLRGESAVLTWSCTHATSVTACNFGATTVSGMRTVAPAATTDYTLAVYGDGGTATAHVTVTVATVAVNLATPLPLVGVGKTVQLAATVVGAVSTTVTWRVVEPGGGSVSATGLYTAPATRGAYHVEAASTADPSVTASALVAVVAVTTTTNATDGATLVWVPTGPFQMGSPASVGYPQESPARVVTQDGFWIGQYEVTVAQYQAFCTATHRTLPAAPAWGWDDTTHPMVNVSWDDAAAYAVWVGGALPTEAQWEKAARGTDGRNYPWGGRATAADITNGWDPSCCANLSNSAPLPMSGMQDGPWPVGTFVQGVSPYGAWDMAGNVWEWCRDWYAPGYDPTATTNPTGPTTGSYRVLHGGSWNDIAVSCRCAFRYFLAPTDAGNYAGFRYVIAAPGPMANHSVLPGKRTFPRARE